MKVKEIIEKSYKKESIEYGKKIKEYYSNIIKLNNEKEK